MSSPPNPPPTVPPAPAGNLPPKKTRRSDKKKPVGLELRIDAEKNIVSVVGIPETKVTFYMGNEVNEYQAIVTAKNTINSNPANANSPLSLTIPDTGIGITSNIDLKKLPSDYSTLTAVAQKGATRSKPVLLPGRGAKLERFKTKLSVLPIDKIFYSDKDLFDLTISLPISDGKFDERLVTIELSDYMTLNRKFVEHGEAKKQLLFDGEHQLTLPEAQRTKKCSFKVVGQWVVEAAYIELPDEGLPLAVDIKIMADGVDQIIEKTLALG